MDAGGEATFVSSEQITDNQERMLEEAYGNFGVHQEGS
jgi:hypothetical protein